MPYTVKTEASLFAVGVESSGFVIRQEESGVTITGEKTSFNATDLIDFQGEQQIVDTWLWGDSQSIVWGDGQEMGI